MIIYLGLGIFIFGKDLRNINLYINRKRKGRG